MMTKDQAYAALVTRAAEDFLNHMHVCATNGVKTPEQVTAYTARLNRALTILHTHPDTIVRLADGTFHMKSTGKYPELAYGVDRSTCTCPDAGPNGKAPGGWCKHRFVAYLLSVADTQLRQITERTTGLPVPHEHPTYCGHGYGTVQCWDGNCQEPVMAVPASCTDCAATVPAHEVPETPEHHTYPPEQYEVARPYTTQPPPLPETACSVNLTFKRGQIEVMLTMRAHTDQEILDRLPGMLAGLERKLGRKEEA
jgi:hypothetical protein